MSALASLPPQRARSKSSGNTLRPQSSSASSRALLASVFSTAVDSKNDGRAVDSERVSFNERRDGAGRDGLVGAIAAIAKRTLSSNQSGDSNRSLLRGDSFLQRAANQSHDGTVGESDVRSGEGGRGDVNGSALEAWRKEESVRQESTDSVSPLRAVRKSGGGGGGGEGGGDRGGGEGGGLGGLSGLGGLGGLGGGGATGRWPRVPATRVHSRCNSAQLAQLEMEEDADVDNDDLFELIFLGGVLLDLCGVGALVAGLAGGVLPAALAVGYAATALGGLCVIGIVIRGCIEGSFDGIAGASSG